MLASLLQNLRMLFFPGSVGRTQYTLSGFKWRVPSKAHWHSQDVFTATGLLIGRGIVAISRADQQVIVADVHEHHLKDSPFDVEVDESEYASTMVTRDYSQTAVICLLSPKEQPPVSPVLNTMDTLAKKWVFCAHDLYWEHGNGCLVPFFEPNAAE